MAVSGGDIVGAAAGGASMLPAIFGRGQNKQLASGFVGQPGYDPNAAFYGGQPGGLQAYQQQIGQKQALVDGRGAYQADYSQANVDRALGRQARTDQGSMAGLMAARARGQVPSIAQMQADRQMGQATNAQASAAASARGPGGMALSQQNAANNVANAHGAISGQAQVNAAQERQQAEQAAFGAYSNMRQGDLGSQGQAANQAQFNTTMQQQNRNANDTRAMGYEQMGANANQAELQARTHNQGTLAGAQSNATAANQRTGDQNAQSKGLVETIGDFFSDANAKIMLSDMSGKVPSLMPGGGAMNPTATTSFDKLGSDGSLDVLGSLKAHSDFATRFQGAPGAGAGPSDPTMMSDTRAKQTALLAEGRKQGARAAQTGGPSLNAMLDDRAQGPYGANADSAALDDRAAQHASAGMGKAALDDAIGSQVATDKTGDAGDPALEQWKRSFGEPEQAAAGVQNSDNRAEAERIRRRFGTPVVPGAPGAATAPTPWWASVGAAGKSLSDAQFGGGQMVSDERAKRAAFAEGAAYATKNITGKEMEPWAQGDTNEGEDAAAPDPHANYVAPDGPNTLPDPPRPRQMKSFERSNPIADANRSMVGSPYAYKPGLAPPEQKPGEVNVGPMAQNLETSPVAATAVKTDPATGLKTIDRDKALKVAMSGIADLQRQQDETRTLLAKGGRKRQ